MADKITHITHFEIIGKDSKRLRDFYATLFHWKMNVQQMGSGEYCLVETGQFPNGGITEAMPGGRSNAVTIFVGVDDLDATLKQAVAMGGKISMPPTEVPGVVTFAMFEDPSGNVIGLTKNMP
jgi:predicted enzyme related to lactoylglutathione lyase